MKKYFNNKWFTLIEIIVSVTILSIVMISIFMIFIKSSEVNRKIDVWRLIQENVKNIIETISEDVRVQWINIGVWYHSFVPWEYYSSWSILYVWSNKYYLAKYDNITNTWISRDNSQCSSVSDNCFIVKNDWVSTSPLSNSWVQLNNLTFYVSNDFEKKVTINMILEPASRKWLQSNLIKNNKIIFQTTLSERLYKDY